MEPLKEAVEAWLHRVRAPILGYTLLAGLAINWKALWALLFSEIDLFSRFLYFDLRTDLCTLFVFPLVVGFVSAIASPWIGLVGAWCARKPTELLRKIQHDARVEQEIYRLETQARVETAKAREERARETRKLAELKRTQEAAELGEEALDAFEEARESNQTVDHNAKLSLSELEKFAILVLGTLNGEVSAETISQNKNVAKDYMRLVPNATPLRLKTELEDALQRVQKLGLAKRSPYGEWSLTSTGYEEHDRLSVFA